MTLLFCPCAEARPWDSARLIRSGGCEIVTTKTHLLALAGAAVAAGAASLAVPTVAHAEGEPSVQQIGQQGKLIDGGNVQGWTVGALQPSADAISFTPRGTLWEVTATDEAIAGGAVPFIPDFSARAVNGESYQVLFQVPSPQGVNPSGLSQGQSVTGKLYFDVTGSSPDSVVYGNRLIWVQPPPGAATDGAAPARTGGTGQSTYTAPQTGSGASASGATGSGASSSQGATQSAPAQSAPAQTAPAQTAAPKAAPAAAADDVQGSATAAQPTPTAAPLDVHDTAVPATTSPTPAAQGTASTPTATAAPAPASAPATAAAAATATPAPAAAQVAPTTTVPAPASSSTGG